MKVRHKKANSDPESEVGPCAWKKRISLLDASLHSQYLKNLPGAWIVQCFTQAENLLRVVDPEEGRGRGW